MAHVLEMPDGQYITPFCFLDALDAVEEYAGRELRDFIEEYMQDNADETGLVRLEAEEARKDKEMSEDHYHEVLLAVQDGLERICSEMDAKRWDRMDLRNLFRTLCDMVNSEL